MKKYRVISDGLTYRVERLYFGLFPVLEKVWVPHWEASPLGPKKPIEFDSKEEAIRYICEKTYNGQKPPRPKRQWKVVWNGCKRV